MTTNTHELIKALEKADERASVKIMVKDYADGWYELKVSRRPNVEQLRQALADASIGRAAEQEPLFLIIAGGDAHEQEFVRGYEPAARAAFKMVIHGEPEDADNNDYDVAIYNAVKDPDSEEWNDAGAQGIVFSFEDGFLQVTRIDAELTPAQPIGGEDVRERVQIVEDLIDDYLIKHQGRDAQLSYTEGLAEAILAALSATTEDKP